MKLAVERGKGDLVAYYDIFLRVFSLEGMQNPLLLASSKRGKVGYALA